jgi:hypothetical protein
MYTASRRKPVDIMQKRSLKTGKQQEKFLRKTYDRQNNVERYMNVYLCGTTLIHQINVLVSPDAKQTKA